MKIRAGLPGLALAALAACSATPPVAGAPATAETPAQELIYRCDDGGELRVYYAGNEATVSVSRQAGRTLRRAESAAQGSEVYVGDALSLHRDGDRIRLIDGASTRQCTVAPTPN